MADDTRLLRLIALYDGKQVDEGLLHNAEVAEATGKRISEAGATAGTKFGDAMDHATTRAGGFLGKLSSTASSFGIPTGGLDRFGEKLAEAETKGQKFTSVMSEIGKVTLVAGAAGLAATGIEAIHLADSFDSAQASLETATKAAGGSWAQMQAQAKAASETTAALVTGNAQDVDSALATLVTATGSTSKALKDLGLVEDIAAMKHVSLEDAAQGVAKVFAGSTRVLTQWGINLDIGSGKLHSIQSAQMAVQSAQLALNSAIAEQESGAEKGARGAAMVAAAQLRLRDAQINLRQSQDAVSESLDVLNQKTRNAALLYSDTPAGKVAMLKDQIHNLGIDLGEALIPKIETLVSDGDRVIGFFERNHGAAVALAAVIAGPLALAVSVFAFNKVEQLVTGATKMITWFANIGSGAAASAAEQVSAATTETAASTTSTDIMIANLERRMALEKAAGMEEAALATQVEIAQAKAAQAWETTNAAITGIASEQEGMLATLGADYGTMGTEAAAGATAAEAGVTASSAAIVASLASVALEIGVVIAAYEAYKQITALVNGQLNPNDTTPLTGSSLQKMQESYDRQHGYGAWAQHMGWSGGPSTYPAEYTQALAAERGNAGSAASAQIAQAAGATSLYTPAQMSAALQQQLLNQELAQPGGLGSVPSPAALGGGTPYSSGSSSKSSSGMPAVESQILGLLNTLQGAMAGATPLGLEKATSGANAEKMFALVVAAHRQGFDGLAAQLEGTWTAALAELREVLAIKEENAFANWANVTAAEINRMTTLVADDVARMVQGVTDSATLASDKASAASKLIADQAKTAADTLAERGKYGLDLVAAQEQVTLDKLTTLWDRRIGSAQTRLDTLTKTQDAAVAAAQKHLDVVTEQNNVAVQKAEAAVAAAGGGSQLQQAQAQAALNAAQAQAAYQEALAGRALKGAEDAASLAEARAQASLSSAESQAQMAEARMQAILTVEEARAQYAFAGGGLVVNQFGVTGGPAENAAALAWIAKAHFS